LHTIGLKDLRKNILQSGQV